MSIDLDWSNLDASFASSFIGAFNSQLQNIPRPSFIGPIEITSFDFGSQPPDIELVDLRDIYRDFLEDDDNDDDNDNEGSNNDLGPAERGPGVRSAASAPLARRAEDEDEDEFEWVSRSSARRGLAAEEAAPMYYHHLPPHIRYARGPASDVFALALAHPPPPPSPSPHALGSVAGGSARSAAGEGGGHHVPASASMSTSSVPGGGGGGGAAAGAAHSEQQRATTTTFSSNAFAPAAAPSRRFPIPDARQTKANSSSSSLGSTRPPGAPPSLSSSPSPPFSPHRGLAHISVDTAPAPAPPAQTAAAAMAAGRDTTFAAAGTLDEPTTAAPPADEHPNLQLHLLVSWHSDLRLTLTTSLRINYPSPQFMSLPIKLAVTGLVFNGELAVAYEGGRRVHLCVLDDLDPYGPSARRSAISQGSTPSDPEGDDAHEAKPLPVGQRLLPEIFIESELGQADKHVLKNVTRVEKFIQDVIRKTIEDELVFPNFHTLVLR